MSLNEKIKDEILKATHFAPTGDNSQHWDLFFENEKLIINHNKLKASHILNDNLSASLLSLGTVIETLIIKCSEYSLRPEVNYFIDDLSNDKWAEVSLTSDSNIEKENLIEFLPKRETNRKKFEKKNFNENFLEGIKKYGEENQVKVYESSSISKRLRQYLIKCELYIWNNRQVFLDTAKWIRFNKNEIEKTRDGFGLKNLNLKTIDGLFIKLFLKSSLLLKILWAMGMSFKVKLDAQKSISKDGTFIFFTANGESSENVVNVGRVFFRTWLSLNKAGHGVQPLTVSSLLPYDLEKYGTLRDCSESYLDMFSSSNDIFTQDLNLNKEEKVVWAMRTGKCNPLRKCERTLRVS